MIPLTTFATICSVKQPINVCKNANLDHLFCGRLSSTVDDAVLDVVVEFVRLIPT